MQALIDQGDVQKAIARLDALSPDEKTRLKTDQELFPFLVEPYLGLLEKRKFHEALEVLGMDKPESGIRELNAS